MAWSYLQGAINADTGATSLATVVATFGSNLTAGSLIWVGVASLSGVNITGVTDTAGNTYTQIGSTLVNASQGYQVALFFAFNPVHTTASNAVTATFSAAVTFRRCHAQEELFSGAFGYTLDTSATGQNTTGSVYTTTAMTPSTTVDLAVQIAGEQAANDVAPGTGWNAREPTTATLSTQSADQALTSRVGLTGSAKSNGGSSGNWLIMAALIAPTLTQTVAIAQPIVRRRVRY